MTASYRTSLNPEHAEFSFFRPSSLRNFEKWPVATCASPLETTTFGDFPGKGAAVVSADDERALFRSLQLGSRAGGCCSEVTSISLPTTELAWRCWREADASLELVS